MKNSSGEIVLYNPDEHIKIDVRLENETVWLTQQQIANLFGVGQPAISKHLKNIFQSHELDEKSVHSILEYTATDGKVYHTKFYNLDAILSVGYRVNSKNATLFRQWANKVLKEYLLKGYSVNSKLQEISTRLDKHDDQLGFLSERVEFFVRTSLPPVQGIFFEGQIFDAYHFVSELIRRAQYSIILIDNYIDDSVLSLLDKRSVDVEATIYTSKITKQLAVDIHKHNQQYSQIIVKEFGLSHDRFLIIDDVVYHVGASIKDLGKKWFTFCRLYDSTSEDIMSRLKQIN